MSMQKIGEKAYKDTLDTLQTSWKEFLDNDKQDESILLDMGLGFEYETPDNKEPYFRWILACGSPTEEIKFYVSLGISPALYKAEYCFSTWSGYYLTHIDLDSDGEIIKHIWQEVLAPIASSILYNCVKE